MDWERRRRFLDEPGQYRYDQLQPVVRGDPRSEDPQCLEIQGAVSARRYRRRRRPSIAAWRTPGTSATWRRASTFSASCSSSRTSSSRSTTSWAPAGGIGYKLIATPMTTFNVDAGLGAKIEKDTGLDSPYRRGRHRRRTSSSTSCRRPRRSRRASARCGRRRTSAMSLYAFTAGRRRVADHAHAAEVRVPRQLRVAAAVGQASSRTTSRC